MHSHFHQIYMEYTPRKHSFLNSTFCNQTPSPQQSSIDSPRKKRFSRSNSNSQSKCKDNFKTNIPQQTAQFFIKSICKDLLENKAEQSQILNKISLSNRTQKQKIKRASTPAKSQKQVQKPTKQEDRPQIYLESELNGLKLQLELKRAMAQKQRFQAQNKTLQQKLTFLSLQLAESINQTKFLNEKIKYLQQRQAVGKDNKVNGANRIKRLIIQNKDLQRPSIQSLQQTIKSLIYQSNEMRQNLKTAENKIRQMENNFQNLVNERQLFLEDLVQQLKIEVAQKDSIIKKLMIQLNIFLVRQSRRDKKIDQQKEEELQNLKKKYVRILKKYHQISQQLTAFKRKNQRMNYLFPDKSLAKNSSLDSLSFSP